MTTDPVALLLEGRHPDPHAVLGAHRDGDALVVRALRPLARTVTARLALPGGPLDLPLTHVCDGLWSATTALPAGHGPGVPAYTLVVDHGGGAVEARDAYSFLPTLGELDLHLLGEGRHERLWEALGAHVTTVEGCPGTRFTVWAPGAAGVRVVGDHDGWDGVAHPMRRLGGSGVWELFVPGLPAGTRYKFAVLGADGTWRHKADPLARQAEVPPATASVVAESRHVWDDEAWLARRAAAAPHAEPVSIYEVHLGSWRQGLGYRELAHQLADHVVSLGFTHVELLPVTEHPFGGSWGYQVTGYFAPTSRFGSPDDLRYLVDHLHGRGVGVLLDWVPAHFPKDEWALARFDGTPLYEHPDPRRGEHPDWGTFVFDLGRPQVRNFLVASALHWLEEFHLDGIRVDAVASMLYLDYSREPGQWTPNAHGGRENLEAVAFLQELTATAYRLHPGVLVVAEESTAWPGVTARTDDGGLGFGFKWNMGWMHDTLTYLGRDPVHRSHHHGELTFSLAYAWSEHYVLPISHDEVVHGKGSLLTKMPGDRWRQLAGVRALLGHMWAHPGKQLLFMGCELAQPGEWDHDGSLDWALLADPAHRGVSDLVRDLNTLYRTHPALWRGDDDPAGFQWLVADDESRCTVAYLRRDPHDPGAAPVVCVANFAAVPHADLPVPLPVAGPWREILNTDAHVYGGSGVGNLGAVEAVPGPHGGGAVARLQVPPLAVLWLTPGG